MVVVALRESADAWDLVRGGLAEYNSAFHTAHNILPSQSASNGGPVLLFTASTDTDALVTVRTLTSLLKADLIRYEVHPIEGYEELNAKIRSLVVGNDTDEPIQPRIVLCVNCGAMVDLETVLNLDELQADLRFLVIDSHRPYHLRNINSQRVIIQHDTDDFNIANLPINLNIEDVWGNVPDELSSDEDDDDDDDDDSDSESDLSDFIDDSELNENESNGGEESVYSSRPTSERNMKKKKEKKKRNRSKASSSDAYLDDAEEDDVKFDESEDEGDGEDGDDDRTERDGTAAGSRKRKRVKSPSLAKQKQKKQRFRRRRRNLSSLDEDDPEVEARIKLREYYANAMTGTSSACISHGIAMLLRRSNEDTLWMAILGMTCQYITQSIDTSLYENQMTFCREEVKQFSNNNNEDRGGGNDSGEVSNIQNIGYVPSRSDSNNNTQKIYQSTELRLDLLRHWSLFDSLMFSSYTCTRLLTWRQIGKRRLLEILATLGIALNDSKQKWEYMLQKNKILLEQNLQSTIDRFDLGQQLQYDSFLFRLPGNNGVISASDYIHCVSILLEINTDLNISKSKIDKFWYAYDSLDYRNNLSHLKNGLKLAVQIQSLTAQIGGNIIEAKKFISNGPFRYVFLKDDLSFNNHFLIHPILLRRLALFLNLALLRQGATDKPFIILAPNLKKNVWIAVATTTSSQRNDFGHRFRKAAERNGSTITHSGFDSSVCEIKDGQEIEFVRFLHDVM